MGTQWQISMSLGMIVSPTFSPIHPRTLFKFSLGWTGKVFISMFALSEYCSDWRVHDAGFCTWSFKWACLFPSLEFSSLRDLYWAWTALTCSFIFSLRWLTKIRLCLISCSSLHRSLSNESLMSINSDLISRFSRSQIALSFLVMIITTKWVRKRDECATRTENNSGRSRQEWQKIQVDWYGIIQEAYQPASSRKNGHELRFRLATPGTAERVQGWWHQVFCRWSANDVMVIRNFLLQTCSKTLVLLLLELFPNRPSSLHPLEHG